MGMRNTIIVIILCFSAGVLGVWIGKSIFVENADHVGDLHSNIHHSLNLSQVQEQEFHILEQKFNQQKRVLGEKLKAANGSLSLVIAKDHQLSVDVRSAGDEYLKILGELQQETLRHIFQMRCVLDVEQARQFDIIVMRSFHAAAE